MGRTKNLGLRVTGLLANFGAELKVVIAEKDVSYRWLAETTRARRGVPLPQASVSRLLNGRNEPDWRMVKQILVLCDVDEDEIHTEWLPKWRHLIKQIRALELTEQISPIPSTIDECAECGAAVLNHDRHAEYHEKLEAQARRKALKSVS